MVSWSRSTLFLGLTLAVASPRYVSGQAAHRWSTDVTLGAAVVEGADFFDNGKAAAHFAIADRVLQGRRFATYLEAAYDWFGRFGLLGANPDLVCITDRAGGGCKPDFPDVTGPSASVGLLYAPVTRVEARVGVGGAAYSVNGIRVGAALGQLDVAVFPAAEVGLILGARFAVIPRYRDDRLTMIPVLLGVRVR